MAVKDYVIQLEAQLGKTDTIIKDVKALEKNLKIKVDLDTGSLTEVTQKIKLDAYTIANVATKINEAGEQTNTILGLTHNQEKKISDELKARLATQKEYVKKQEEAQAFYNKQAGIKVGGVEEDYDKRRKTELMYRDLFDKQEKQAWQEQRRAMKENLLSWDNIKESMQTAMVRSVQWGLSMGAIYGTIHKIRDLMQNVLEINEQMTSVRIITGASQEEANGMLKTYQELARETSSLTTEVIASADEFLRQGRTVEETNELIKTSSVMAKVALLDSTQSAELLTSAINGYQMKASQAMSVVDKLTAVDAAAATSTEELATAMARTANSARIAGVDMDTLIGYIGTVSSVTRGSAESIGNSFKSIFARMQNVRIGSLFDEDGESVSKVDEALQQYGIHLRNEQGTFRDTSEVIDEIGKRWKEFNNAQQSEIATAIAGTLQRERFLTLMENYPMALELAEVATNSAGSAMEKFAISQESITSKLTELKNEFQIFSTNILEGQFVAGLVEAGVELARFANTDVGLAITQLTLLALAIGAVAFAFSTLKSSVILGSIISGFSFIGVSIVEVATGVTTLSNVFGALGISMGILPIIAVTAGLIGLGVAFEKLTPSVENQTKKITDLYGELEELKEEASGLSSLFRLSESEKERLDLLKEEIALKEEAIKKEAEYQYELMNRPKQGLAKDSSVDMDNVIASYKKLSTQITETEKAEKQRMSSMSQYESIMTNYAKTLNDLQRAGVELNDKDKELLATIQRLTTATDDHSNVSIDLKDIVSELDSIVAEYTGALNYLAEIEDKVTQGTALSAEEKDKLLERYPQLESAVYAMADGYGVETNALNVLKAQLKATAEGHIASEESRTATSRSHAEARIKIIQQEINALRSLPTTTGSSYIGDGGKLIWGGDSANLFGKAITQREQEVNKLKNEIAQADKAIASALAGVQGASGKSSYVGGGSSSSKPGGSGSSAKSSTDTWKQAFEEQHKLLQHKLTMDEISEEEYLNRLEVLYKKYFENKKQYSDEYMRYEEEVYTKRKKLEEQALKESLEAEKKKIQAQQGALNSLVDMTVSLIKQEKADEKAYYNSLIQQEKDRHSKVIRNLKDEVQAKKDALNKELAGYKRIIDAQLESLKNKQKDRTYQQDLSEKQKELAKLEAELVELGFDDSAEGKAKRLQLQEEISKQRLEIENLQYDKGIELQENALNKEYDRYKENIDNQLEQYDKYLKDEEKRYEQSLNNRVDDYQSYINDIDNFLSKEGLMRQEANRRIETGGKDLFMALLKYNTEYGTLSEEVMEEMWNTATGAMTDYEQKQLSVLDTLRILAREMDRVSTDLGGGTGKGASLGGTSAKAQEQLNQQKYLHNLMVQAKADNNTGLISWIKQERIRWNLDPNSGAIVNQYHDGGIVSDSPKLKSTETMAKLLKGELVSTESQIERFMNFTLPSMVGLSHTSGGNGDIVVSMPMTFEGDVSSDVMPELKNFVKNTVDTAIGQLNKAMKQQGKVRNARVISI